MTYGLACPVDLPLPVQCRDSVAYETTPAFDAFFDFLLAVKLMPKLAAAALVLAFRTVTIATIVTHLLLLLSSHCDAAHIAEN